MRGNSYKRVMVVAVGTLAVMTLAGCSSDSGSSSSKPKPTTSTVVTPKAGSTVHAKVGTNVVVQVVSNPTTGYQWTAKQVPGNIRLVSTKYVQPKKNAIGASGFQRFTFEPTRPGSGQVTLVYERSFAQNEPGKTLTFTVAVKQKS